MNKKKVLQLSIGLIVAGLLSTLFLYAQTNQQQHLTVITLLVFLGLVLVRLQSTRRNLKGTIGDLEFRKQALNKHAIVRDRKSVV